MDTAIATKSRLVVARACERGRIGSDCSRLWGFFGGDSIFWNQSWQLLHKFMTIETPLIAYLNFSSREGGRKRREEGEREREMLFTLSL